MRLSRTYPRRGRRDRREMVSRILCVLCDLRVRRCVTGVALVVLLPELAQAQAQAQATLRYQWKQGEPVTYKTTLKTDSTVSGVAGMGDVTLNQTMTQRIKLMPAAVAPDGTVTLQQTIEAVSVEMTTPMGKIAFDSGDPSSGQDEASAALAQVFGGIVGATLSVTMAPSGAIQRIDGVQRVLDKVTQNLPQERAALQMALSLKSVLSEAAIRASLEQSFPRMPPQPVKAGDSWTAQISLGSDVAGKIAGTQTLTLKSIEGGVATIDVALALKQETAPPMGPSGMIVKLGDSRGTGTLAFDVAAGRIRAASMTTDMPSTMTATGPDGRPATMKNTTKTSMTMEEIK
jgi:uncharacterized beta-barrel protein YwiB (DUF1934 family)